MKATNFFLSVVLVSALAILGCGSDSGGAAGSGGTSNGGGDGDACNVDDCATSDALMAACLDIYQDCLDVGERSEGECRDLAESANCRLNP